MGSKIAIVIPIYKENPDKSELFSIKTLANVTEFKYDIFFVRPSKEFNMKTYYDSIQGWENHVFECPFDKKYFQSTSTYSQLCKSYEFYTQFVEYDYMLIYQTDCLLIKDELTKWAEYGYDYIGAPIIGTGSAWERIPFVGNGGLSMRKIDTFMKITKPDGEFLKEFGDDIELACKENNAYLEFEDVYFAELISDLWCGFSKPNYKLAGEFAWDRNMDALYSMYLGKLPMGLHAWDKQINFIKMVLHIPDDILIECYEKITQ